jgi:MSHA pilin protein MshB
MKKQQGFTLIELVIVVIILGLLGAAAVPRFLDATDDARDASVEGVAGGFASAVGLVRAEWELAGRPDGATDVSYDGVALDVTDTGYPAGSGDEDAASDMDAAGCQFVFSSILQSSPTSILAGGTDYDGERYVVRKSTNGNCQYALAEDIAAGATVSATFVNDAATTAGVQGFTYNADSGQVTVFKN